jgi:hypothetical protein
MRTIPDGATPTPEALAAEKERLARAGCPLGEYEDAEAMFQDLSDTLTDAGVNDTLAFFIATAAFDFANKHTDVFAAYLAGEVTDETIQDALGR